MGKRIVRMLMTLCAVIVIMLAAPQEAEAATMTKADVEAKIATIRAVYPTGSQFTKNGSACPDPTDNSCDNCLLSNIPSRGGLPSGATVSKVCVDGWTCIGFARYVFYTTFGISEKNSKNTTVNGLDTAVVGDYIRCLNSSGSVLHAGIFMGWATKGSTFYLYESNDGAPNKVAYKVRTYSATNHSKWKSFTTTHAYNYESDTSAEVSVSFADYSSKISIGSTNATLAKTISVTGASISSVSKVGIRLYNSAGTYLDGASETPNPSNGVINAWYDINSELGYTLSPSTTYKYQFYAVIAGKEYPSSTYSFTTASSAVSFTFSDNSKQSIGTTNATLAKTISIANGSIDNVTSVGIRLYNSVGTLLASKSEDPTPSNGVINAWYGVNDELSYTLSPGTTYKYQFYAVYGSKTYYSSTYSFTTAKTSVTATFAKNTEKYSVGTTNAVPAMTLSVSGASISSVTKVGIYLYNSSGTKIGEKSETPKTNNGVINIWYDVNSELSVTLTPATKYYYEMTATISGVTYRSAMQNFTTNHIAITSLTLSSTSVKLDLSGAQTKNISATYAPTNATATALTWSSSNTAVATISGGVITPVKVGTATITCKAPSGVSASCAVTVVDTMSVGGVSVSGTQGGLAGVGDTVKWTVDATSAGSLSYYYTLARNGEAYTADGWVTGNTFSYTFTETGDYVLYIAVYNNSTQETYDTESATVTVLPAPESIVLNRSSLTMAASGYGSRLQLTANVYPYDSLFGAISWSSSDAGVVDVSAAGGLTAVASGTAVITAMEESGVSASCTVTVRDDLATMILPDSTLEVSDEAFLNTAAERIIVPDGATTIGADAFSGCANLRYVVLPASVTEIGENAFAGCSEVYILSPDGSVAAQYAAGEFIDWFDSGSSFKVPVSAVSLNVSEMTLENGALGYLNASVSPENATHTGVTWHSSNTAVATVNNGVVTATGVGSALITAVAADGSGARASASVTVTPVAVRTITLSSGTLTLVTGNSATLTASVLPANASNPGVGWTSSNTAVATVSGGVVKAVGAGTATITAVASDGSGTTASCKVTVSAPVSTAAISFTGITSTPSSTDAYVYVNAVATATGDFTESGLRVWDANGTLVVQKTEKSAYTRSSLQIWYNITEETGVVLSPGQTYTWQIYTIFNGEAYWTTVQSFTTEVNKEITFTDYTSTPDSTDAYVYVKAVAETTGQFSKSGLYVWDNTGKQVVNKSETSSYSRSELQIWYNITEETGVVLSPSTTYTWQAFTVFNGTTYLSDKKTFTTAPADKTVYFEDLTFTATDTNVYLLGTAKTSKSGSYTKAGMRVMNSSGKIVASYSESASDSDGSMNIWYDVANDTGNRLSPSTTYTAQISATFGGVTYWSSATTFTTKAAVTYDSTLSTATMVSNLRNSTAITKKRTAIATMAEFLLNDGYSPAFVAGVLGNLYHEGSFGLFESSAYSSGEPAYLVYMDENYNYRTKYSYKRIYNSGMSLSAVKTMLDELYAAGWPGKFGLGSLQWTGGRTRTLVNFYIAEAGSSDTITSAQTETAEMRMIKYELEKSYSSIYTKWKTNYSSRYYSLDAAFNAGFNFCTKFEKPSNYHSKAHTRGKTALTMFNIMMGQ